MSVAFSRKKNYQFQKILTRATPGSSLVYEYFSQWSDVFMLPWYLRPCRAEGLHFSAYRHSLLLVSICLLLFLSPSTIVFTACFECPALCSRVYIFFLRPHESLVLLFPLPTAAATASLAFMMLVSDIPLYTSHTLSYQLQWFQKQLSLITLMKKCYQTWFCLQDTHFPQSPFVQTLVFE